MTKKICILGFDDYAMLTGDSSYGYVGGESVQHVLLARAWRDLGHEVTLLVSDHGQARVTTVDGIRAIAAYPLRGGVFALRFIHPRMTRFVRALRDVDADLYYGSPASPWVGVAAWYAKAFGKRSVLRIASDSDCQRAQLWLRYRRDRWMFDYGIKHASLVAAQTEQQRGLLMRDYRRASELVNIAVEVPQPALARDKDIDVLWVGNLRQVKRPEQVIELAKRLPQYKFAIVGGALPGGAKYFEAIAEQARALPNIVMTGGLPYAAVGAWFERARLHINTSEYEGFPNTFLQSWVRAVPVVSFFDPDRLIERRALGKRPQGIESMAAAIDELLTDTPARIAMGARAREFVSTQYSAREVAQRYLDLLDGPADQRIETQSDAQPIPATRDR